MRIPFTEIGYKPASSQPDEDKEQAQKLEALYQADDAIRKQVEPAWLTNILFLAGNQREQASNDMQRWGRKAISTPSTKCDIVVNKIYPRVRQKSYSLISNMRQSVCVPATRDEEDVAAAELATTCTQAWFEEHGELDRRTVEVLWSMCAGRCIRFVWFDPDRDGIGLFGPLPGAGDIANTTLNPFRYHWPHFAEPTEAPPYIIVSDVRDVGEVNDLYPDHDVQEEETAAQTGQLDRLLTGIVEGSAGGTGTAAKRPHSCILKRMYCSPSAKYPAGWLFVWTTGKLLQSVELPEAELTMTALDWQPLPGSNYPMPLITQAIGAQKEFNITIRQLIELRNRQLRGDIIYRGGSKVVVEIDPKTGAKRIRVPLDGSDFKLMEYNLNTNEAMNIQAMLKEDLDDGFGIHDPSLGGDIKGDPTLGQINILQQADMAGSSFFLDQLSRAYCKVDSAKLLVAQNHFDIPRVIRDVGRDMQADAVPFFGSDLKGTRDVRPSPTPVVTEQTKMALRAKSAELGLFDMTGTPEQKIGKVDAMLSLGLPKEEVEEKLGDMTIDQLREIAGQFTKDNMALAIVMQKAQMMQLEQQMNPPEDAGAMGGAMPQDGAQGVQPQQGLQMVQGGA